MVSCAATTDLRYGMHPHALDTGCAIALVSQLAGGMSTWIYVLVTGDHESEPRSCREYLLHRKPSSRKPMLFLCCHVKLIVRIAFEFIEALLSTCNALRLSPGWGVAG